MDYVFGQVLSRLGDTARWHERTSEQDPRVNDRIDPLEAERAALREQRDRAGKSFVLGVLSERDAQREVEWIDTEFKAIERKANDLLRRPAISTALKEGFDRRGWTAGQRRAFLKLLIDRVVVIEWHVEVSRVVSKRLVETPEQYDAREREQLQEVVAERVRIEWVA